MQSITSAHPETAFMGVILMSPASGGTKKNLIVPWSAEILRGACRRTQDDMEEFPDGN